MATYTVANGGGNINAASTYVGGVGIPGVADEIVFTTTSGQLTVNSAITIQDIDFSNYTNVITFTTHLNVSRNIIFGDAGGLSTYTTAGTEGIRKTGTGNVTSNGKFWTASFIFSPVTYTVTLMDKVTISGAVVANAGGSYTVTLNSNNVLDPERFDVLGDFTFNAGTSSLLTGNALIKFTGTANQSVSWTSNGVLRNNIKVDKTGGTLSFSGTINYNTGTFTYVQGNTDTGTSTLNISNQPVTLDTKGSSSAGATTASSTGINWYNIIAGSTITLTSNLTAINNFTSSIGATTFSGTTQKVYLGGGLTASNTITSTSVETIFNGTGVWTGTSVISCPLTINTLGTITITGSVNYTTRTFTYTSGTNTGAGTIIFGAGATLNLGANKLNVNAALVGNITLGSNTTFTNLTTQTTAVVLSGAFTINVEGNLAINIATSGASTPIVINGSGSQTWTSTAYLSASLTIAKTVGSTLLLSANTYYGTGTLTYVSGTIDSTTNSNTLNLTGSPSLNTLGTTWNKVAFSNVTITLLSDFTATGLTNVVAPAVGTALSVAINGVGRKYYANGGMTCNSTSSNGTLSGTAELRFEGVGYWQTVASGNNSTWYQIDTVINPTGNFFIDVRFIINKITYSNTNGGAITSANLFIGTNTTNVWSGGITLDTNDLFWNSITYFNHNNTAGSSSTLTSLSNINCNYWIFYNVGTATNFNINFSFTSGGILNTGTFYIAQRVIVNLPTNANFETDNLYFSNGGAAITGNNQLNNGIVVVKKVLEKQDAFNSSFGTTLIKFANNSSWSNLNGGISFVMEILGNVTFNGNSYSQATLKYTGNINSPIAKGTLNITANCALTNMHKLTFNNLVITSGTIMTMNEFFSGLPNKNSVVAASSTTNFDVTFTDNFEKIAKFVNINGVTLTRPQQLLLLTNQPKKSRNSGIRYGNNLPNGIAKGDPSVPNNLTVGQTRNLLVGDPSFVKSI